MKSLNKCFLIGSVGRDPELRSTPNGALIANFSIATSDRYKDSQGNWQDKPEWHNLVAIGKTAEIVRDYVQKGAPLHIEGKIQTRQWEKDGQKHWKTEILIEQLIMLGGNKKQEPVDRKTASAEPTQEISDDDVPF